MDRLRSRPWLLCLIGSNDGLATSALLWLDAIGEAILETELVRLPDMSSLVMAVNEE